MPVAAVGAGGDGGEEDEEAEGADDAAARRRGVDSGSDAVVEELNRKLLGPVSYFKARTLRSLPQTLLVPSLRTSSSAGSLPSLASPSPLTASRATGGDATLPSGTTMRSDTSFSDPEVLRPSWERSGADADAHMTAVIRRSKSRQLRTPFCVSSISPLMQRYLNADSSTIGKPIILKRTTPVPWSAVGGVETFHATVPRTDVQDSIRSGIASAKATYQEKMTASKETEATLLREVKSLRNAVLHSGQNSRSKYCLHITDQQADRRKSSHPGATAAHMHADDMRTKMAAIGKLPVPSTLVSLRAPASEWGSGGSTSDGGVWNEFQASALGWTPLTTAMEYNLLPSGGSSVAGTARVTMPSARIPSQPPSPEGTLAPGAALGGTSRPGT